MLNKNHEYLCQGLFKIALFSTASMFYCAVITIFSCLWSSETLCHFSYCHDISHMWVSYRYWKNHVFTALCKARINGTFIRAVNLVVYVNLHWLYCHFDHSKYGPYWLQASFDVSTLHHRYSPRWPQKWLLLFSITDATTKCSLCIGTQNLERTYSLCLCDDSTNLFYTRASFYMLKVAIIPVKGHLVNSLINHYYILY